MSITPKNNEGYLEGQLLIATPVITGSCFYRAVIYVCVHNEDGAMGIVINHLIQNVTIRDILKQLSIEPIKLTHDIPVHFGGPVDPARGFVLHTDDYSRSETVLMGESIALTSNIEVLRDIALGQGPAESLLALGYAGWAPGQLEEEIEANSWITVPATKELVFDTGNPDKWTKAAASVGIDLLKLSTTVGHA